MLYCVVQRQEVYAVLAIWYCSHSAIPPPGFCIYGSALQSFHGQHWARIHWARILLLLSLHEYLILLDVPNLFPTRVYVKLDDPTYFASIFAKIQENLEEPVTDYYMEH